MISVDIACDLMDETSYVWTKPAGKVVHLRVLPGAMEDYEALIRRAITLA